MLLVLMCHSIVEMNASPSCWGVRFRPPFKTYCKDHCVEAVDDCVPGFYIDTPGYWIAFQPGNQYATKPRHMLLNPSGMKTPCKKELNLPGVYNCLGSVMAEASAGGAAATAVRKITEALWKLPPVRQGLVISAAVVGVVTLIDSLFGGPLKWCTYCEMLSCVDDLETSHPTAPIFVVDPTALAAPCLNGE